MTAEAGAGAVTLQDASGERDLPPEEDFLVWAEAALARERPGAEVCIRLVGEAEGRALNARYRGRDFATNVLSFAAELPPGVDSPLLGDLAICVPVVRAEAVSQGKAERAHFAHLTVHGVLHLLGHDHQEPAAAEAMEAREIAVLAGLGFPDPYGDSRIKAGNSGGDLRTPS